VFQLVSPFLSVYQALRLFPLSPLVPMGLGRRLCFSTKLAQRRKIPEGQRLPFHASIFGNEALVFALDALDRQQAKALELAPATQVV